MKMEKDEFLKYRDEIVAMLKKNKIKWEDAASLFASAINEFSASAGYVASVSIAPIFYHAECPQAGANLHILLADNQLNHDSDFVSTFQKSLAKEIEALEQAIAHP